MITNTHTNYGYITKFFHWLTALLILSVLALGVLADNAAEVAQSSAATDQDIAHATTLYSLHKTVGVLIFFTALARVLWACTQTKPDLLNGDNRPEAYLAETIHWLLYGALILTPLTGWMHHAATTGFAPIWWPFGQSLPFVPKDETLATQLAALHHLCIWVLVGSLALHIAGALKHHIIDRDATLRRMLAGSVTATPPKTQPNHIWPFVAALAIAALSLGTASSLGLFKAHETTDQTELAQVNSAWIVTEGTLGIEILQLGNAVKGSFADWTAAIEFTENPDATDKHGTVDVTISIASLQLGGSTQQAMGPDYFDQTRFPTARFRGDIIAADIGYEVRGTLTIRDQSMPLTLPFSLNITDTQAHAQGSTPIDRRDYAVGLNVSDEKSLGFEVLITFDLMATNTTSDGS